MTVLTEKKAEDLLRRYVPVAASVLTKRPEDGKRFAKKHGYPVVLKIISKQALHKTDVGGVAIVRNEEELRQTFGRLLTVARKKKLTLEGVLVQEYVKGQELIIGLKRDAAFGHVLVVGFGGTLVEVLKDVSMRVCPITPREADEMLSELRLAKLLDGYRGVPAVNRKLLVKTLVSVSQLPSRHKRIEEMDINPFIINEKTGSVADCRIVLRD